jgi:hypothetical protein
MKKLRGIFKRKQRDEVQSKATSLPSQPSIPSPTQESIGLPPEPQIETQKPEPSDAWRIAKSGFTRSLELAEIVLGAVPIPGAKAAFTIALRIIQGIDVGCPSPLDFLTL